MKSKFLVIVLISSFCTISPFGNKSVQAQIVSDGTMATPTEVTHSGNLFDITGGTAAGANLFHSFATFSVPPETIARFINNNSSIQNVIGRVTGASASEIFGKITAGGSWPGFNLFLINPNGILFGPQASLDLKGSFVATTANAIQFGNQGFFETANANDPSLLTIQPSAFWFNQMRPQPIRFQSNGLPVNGLEVPDGHSLLLLGGNVELDGALLKAPNGRVALGGLAEPGSVGLTMTGSLLNLNFSTNTSRADVVLENGSLVDVSQNGSGSIAVNAQNITLSGQSVLVTGINAGQTTNGQIPGSIVLNAIDSIVIQDSAIATILESAALGNAGSIVINADSLSLFGTNVDTSYSVGSSILSLTDPSAIGNSGDILITVNSLNLIETSEITSFSRGLGNSGDILLTIRDGMSLVGSLTDEFQPLIASGVGRTGQGESGDILIRAGWLSMSGGAFIRSSVLGTGNTGNILIHVDDFVQLQGELTQIRTVVEAGGLGNGGDIQITARSLSLTDGAQLAASVSGPNFGFPGGQGNGGNITVTATDAVTMSGVDSNGVASGIFANVQDGGTGAAGNIAISTNALQIANGAEVNVSNPGGQAGDITIRANHLTLNNGTITAETGGIGSSTGANIDLMVASILSLENESLISATAMDEADGGNIRINAPILLALPPSGFNGSDIKANAMFGNGGNITINAQGLFGLTEHNALDGNQTNDIDASSQFGRSGRVQTNTTTDPDQGLIELPTAVVDPDALIAQNLCKRGSESEFTRSGRGGVPGSVNLSLSSDATQVDLVEPVLREAGVASTQPPSSRLSITPQQSTEPKITPAQGWIYNDRGEIVLVADHPNVTSSRRLQDRTACSS
jgi:filamentous hemagglutinin family protein